MLKQLMGDGQWCPVDLVVYIFIDMLVSRRWASWQFVASHFCAPKLETRIYKRPYQNQDIFISSFHTRCKLVGLREEVFIWRTLVVDIPYSKVKPNNYCQLQNWKGQPWKGKRAKGQALGEKSVRICWCKLEKHTEKLTLALVVTQVCKYICAAFKHAVSIVNYKVFQWKCIIWTK